MAQHFPIDLTNEPKVRKSIARIGKYIAKSAWLRLRKNCERDCVYNKDIMSLPDEYNTGTDNFVITISPYNLTKKRHDFGGYEKQARLECHFDRQGNINGVYLPV